MVEKALAEDLRQIVGRANVLDAGVDLQLYQYDGYLVERRPDPADRRVINLAITEKGKIYLKQSLSWFKQDLKESLADIDDSDIGKLCTALENTYLILSKLRQE